MLTFNTDKSRFFAITELVIVCLFLLFFSLSKFPATAYAVVYAGTSQDVLTDRNES